MAQPANPSIQPSGSEAGSSARDVGQLSVDNTFQMTTPENIAFHYRLAGPFRRVFPYLLDLLIVSAVYMMVFFVVGWIFTLVAPFLVGVGLSLVVDFLVSIAAVVSLVGGFLAYWFYGAYFETYYNGRTLGKMAGRIRVLSTDGHAIDGVQATLRNFFRGVDLMPFLPLAGLFENDEIPSTLALPTALIGLLVMSISPRYQRLGDLVAGTMVVIREPELNPEIMTFDDARVSQLAELIPDSFYVSSSLARAVAEYVQRRKRLGARRASEVAEKLAGSLMREFGLPQDTNPDLLVCSLYFKVFVGSDEVGDLPELTAVETPSA